MLIYYRFKYRIPEPARWKHTLTIGSTGSGKSELLKTLIHQHILKNKTAIVAFDPNGDFAEQVAMFKENTRPERK
jgi:type IV secretory pathway VirB4 component